MTATQISYLKTCHRKLWLHTHSLYMEHTSDLVADGKLIGETTYERRHQGFKEIELDGVKIDFFDPKTKTVHETKRGKAISQAHRAQVRYYLYKLEQHGVEGASAVIEYPELRQTEKIAPLTEAEKVEIKAWENEVEAIVENEYCPTRVKKSFCKSCAYYDFCFIEEIEE